MRREEITEAVGSDLRQPPWQNAHEKYLSKGYGTNQEASDTGCVRMIVLTSLTWCTPQRRDDKEPELFPPTVIISRFLAAVASD